MTMLADEAWKERLNVGCWQALYAGLEALRQFLRREPAMVAKK